MIDPGFFQNVLAEYGTEFFTGVPDSLLKSFCALLTAHSTQNDTAAKNHIIAVNEGAAVAIAAGYHLATGKIPLVYMQNSGIGNAINPLLSLSDSDIYQIPMLLLVGWRGEPGTKDEPQHVKQGKVTCALFEAMNIPYLVLSDREEALRKQLAECYRRVKKDCCPFALIVRKDTFSPYTGTVPADSCSEEMTREQAIETIIRCSRPDEIFVSTTGMSSRELYELREKYNMGHEQDFLTVGSMGHASSLALALAIRKPELTVNCIDGDGAVLMHMGSAAAAGALKPRNLRHIVINNGAHDSVGGQPTIAREIDLAGIARAAGYTQVFTVKTAEELRRSLCTIPQAGEKTKPGPVFIEVIVRRGSRENLGRPKTLPRENKEAFMRFLSGKSK